MALPDPDTTDSLETYLSELNRFPLLTIEQEQQLARRYRAEGDLDSAHRLVTANLRFVVKVAFEYRSYGLKMGDLIQEGNMGLMKAVQKFDHSKQIRLISYAVWWIRAYIQNHVLKNWSLVKIGTTQAQRKLFFSLARTRRELERLGAGDDEHRIARKLRVKDTEVREMRQRLEGRDLSLDAPVGEDGSASHVDLLASELAPPDESLGRRQETDLVQTHVGAAMARLDARERFIIQQRIMSDQPMTLKELGYHFGFSRERARQLEIRAREKLRQGLAESAGHMLPELMLVAGEAA